MSTQNNSFSNILRIDHEDLPMLLQNAYERKLALFIHGTFGIGKTVMVKMFGKLQAQKLGLKYSCDVRDIDDTKKFVVVVLPMHQYDPSEIKGIPIANRETNKTEFFATELLPTKGNGLIFFDELNLAPPMVQANCYQLINDRRLGSYVLPDGYGAIGAGNMAGDMAHNFEMAMPLRNRFGHVQLMVPSEKDWINNFAIHNEIDHRVITYLGFQPHLYTYDADSDEDNTDLFAIATPRTWEMVSKSIKGLDDMKLVGKFVSMYVGTRIGMSFEAHIKMSKTFDIQAIFKSKKLPRVPTEPSELFALISAITGHYLNDLSDDRAEIMLDLAEQFQNEHKVMVHHICSSSDKEFFIRCERKCPAKFSKIAMTSLKYVVPMN